MEDNRKHNTYLPGYDSIKHHELRTAETCAAYLMPPLRQMVEVNPNLKLLDIGAGPGTISASLARYIPDGQVTAVDLSAEVLARAAENAAGMGVSNIDFKPASVYALPFEDGAFDIVHAHQMLLYLDDPLAGLREMLRVTRPQDGIVAIRNCDMRMWTWWPQLPPLQRFHEVVLASHEASGGTNYGGIQLLSWALQVGIPRERITVSQSTWSYSEPVERQTWSGSFAQRCRKGQFRDKIIESGLATTDELEEMAKAWETWATAEDAWFANMHGEILIRT